MRIFCIAAFFCVFCFCAASASAASPCGADNTLVAAVVALDQPFMYNRLGTAEPQGMIFALERDVVPMTGPVTGALQAGKVKLRDDKRPRPLVLRVNQGWCLQINFRNLLDPALPPQLNFGQGSNLSAGMRYASIHLSGLELVGTISSDGSAVGVNQSSVLPPEGTGGPRYITYTYFAPAEGTYLLYSSADNEANTTNGQVMAGLFGAVTVEPRQAEYYRSQVTREQLKAATLSAGNLPSNMSLSPIVDPRAPRRVEVRRSMFTQETPAAELRRPLFRLTTVDRIQQTIHSSTVVESPDAERRLYTIDAEGGADAGHPIIDYSARNPPGAALSACVPILKMADVPMMASGGRCVPMPSLQVAAANKGGSTRFTTASPHGFRAGDSVSVRNASAGWAAANGVFPVTVITATQFSIPVDSTNFQGNFDGTLGYPRVLFYTDLTAIITGPGAGGFPFDENSPSFNENSAEPDRRQPYREFTIHYHNPQNPVQAFQEFSLPNLSSAYNSVLDAFAINYGIAGIGAEILANRLGVGPMGNADSVDLKFEEFFLSSWAVGDPAMVVDVPANAPNQTIDQTKGPGGGLDKVENQNLQNNLNNGAFKPFQGRATRAYYPDDPSNVYHSYLQDHLKFRVLHAGAPAAHVHHLHAHQWLRSPNSDDSHYLDSQMLTPGAAYTLEIAYGGSGNRNYTPGDSIFHCHFYPHFASGMWSLWRVHDVFEAGTELHTAANAGLLTGTVKSGINRALPDGEIINGTPIPAVVPLPTLAMAPIPADVALVAAYPESGGKDTRRVCVLPVGVTDPGICTKPSPPNLKLTYRNPGFPFFIPGVAGHRPPHPPMDFAWKVDDNGNPVLQNGKKIYLNGGLPRHAILNGKIFKEAHTRWDFTKDFVLYDKKHTLKDGNLSAYELPEDGTAVERAAMAFHARRSHRSFLPNGDFANFITNGLPPTHGAPIATPGVTDNGSSNINNRRYKAAVVQRDVVLNKAGWHFPQQRSLMLWEDVKPTVLGDRPPQPFFFRANTGDTVEYWHTNLVPNYYEMDDFQVRTPTDVIGQHIHLVKFDVLASDGAVNGFNYEDGTFSPDEVRERIFAINKTCAPPVAGRRCGMLAWDDGPRQFYRPNTVLPRLIPQDYRTTYTRSDGSSIFGDPPFGQNWNGAQTTIQLWDTDPLVNNRGVDRTLRTVFTHDHFGPSTHQQAGLYGGLLVEPENSIWEDPVAGSRLYDLRCYDSSGKPLEETVLVCPPGSTRKRIDGGPTSWQALIKTADVASSYREFALEFQDMQLAYTAKSPQQPKSEFQTTAAVLSYQGAAPVAGKVTPEMMTKFAQGGIPLTKDAVVNKDPAPCAKFPGGGATGLPQRVWHVHDPSPPNQDQDFCVGTAAPPNTTPAGVNVWVYSLSMDPGWSSPTTALLPANSGIGNNGAPGPSVISASQSGTYSLNYRNEPVPLRVVDSTLKPLTDDAGDLAYAFRSIPRKGSPMDCQPTPGALITDPCGKKVEPPCDVTKQHCPFVFPQKELQPAGPTGVQKEDPFTPLLRAYQNDNVQIRTLVGAHLTLHSFKMQGINWLMQPTYSNSGYRSMQGMGLSEHYEMLFKLPPAGDPAKLKFADYLYQANAGVDGVMNGTWGILRSYKQGQSPLTDLKPLPNNTAPTPAPADVCAKAANRDKPRTFSIVAKVAPLTYYLRSISGGAAVEVTDQAGMVYQELPASTDPTEPLILRARAGECIEIVINNGLPPTWPGPIPSVAPQGTFATNAPIQASVFNGSPLANINLPVSATVGLHPQLLAYDVTQSNGADVGFNPPATVQVHAASRTLRWFAGNQDGTPVEFGTILLEAADPLLQHFTGLMGVLIIEPEGSTWTTDPGTRASATVVKQDLSSFRELVLMFQSDVENQNINGPTGSLQAAFNYKTEPIQWRLSQVPSPPPTPHSNVVTQLRAARLPVEQFNIRRLTSLIPASPNRERIAAAMPAKTEPAVQPVPPMVLRYSNTLFPANTTPIDPQTPILKAGAGDPVRVRLAWAGGTPVFNSVFNIDGHSWQENPWLRGSTQIGNNPDAQTFGMEQLVPFQLSNFVLQSAGGRARVAGDYLYSMFMGEGPYAPGAWGLLRVSDVQILISEVQTDGSAAGTILLNPARTSLAPALGPVGVTVWSAAGKVCESNTLQLKPGQVSKWKCPGSVMLAPMTSVVATSNVGGRASGSVPGSMPSASGAASNTQ